jgi:hypothetical protein
VAIPEKNELARGQAQSKPVKWEPAWTIGGIANRALKLMSQE